MTLLLRSPPRRMDPQAKILPRKPTSKPYFDALSEPSVPTREGYIGHLSPEDIVRYHMESDQPTFETLEERTNEAPWGDTRKIRIWGQDGSLEAGKDLLTPNKSPYQIPTKLEEVYKDVIGAKLTKEVMAKLCSTEDLLGRYDREILVWHHRLNHFYFKSILILSNRGVIPRKISNIRKPPHLCRLYIWKFLQEAMEDQR